MGEKSIAIRMTEREEPQRGDRSLPWKSEQSAEPKRVKARILFGEQGFPCTLGPEGSILTLTGHQLPFYLLFSSMFNYFKCSMFIVCNDFKYINTVGKRTNIYFFFGVFFVGNKIFSMN